MFHELTKAEKKIARQIIEKGLMKAYRAGLEKSEAVIQTWRQGKLSDRDAYMKFYQTVVSHDKRIARRFDHISGSTYLLVIVGLLADGEITVKDLEGLREETIQRLKAVTGDEE